MKTLTTRTVKISFDGKMLISELIDNLEIDMNDVTENYEASVKLTGNNKYISLVIAAPYSSLSKEARTEANRVDNYRNTIAQAIIVKSLANRLMGNFLIKFYKPPCPCQIFNNTEKAKAWLEEEWEKAGIDVPV